MTETPLSREEALRLGRARYFTGRPCVHGHVAARYTANLGCVVCQRDRERGKYSAGKEPSPRARRGAGRPARDGV